MFPLSTSRDSRFPFHSKPQRPHKRTLSRPIAAEMRFRTTILGLVQALPLTTILVHRLWRLLDVARNAWQARGRIVEGLKAQPDNFHDADHSNPICHLCQCAKPILALESSSDVEATHLSPEIAVHNTGPELTPLSRVRSLPEIEVRNTARPFASRRSLSLGDLDLFFRRASTMTQLFTGRDEATRPVLRSVRSSEMVHRLPMIAEDE